jgi:hypothetical protein
MAEHTTHHIDHKDEYYWTETEPKQPVEYNFGLTPRIYTGRFRKGFDARRHRFTKDECSKGFWHAIESIITRYPDAIMPDGRHIACNFLKSKQTV